jgi:hypothetical protein
MAALAVDDPAIKSLTTLVHSKTLLATESPSELLPDRSYGLLRRKKSIGIGRPI